MGVWGYLICDLEVRRIVRCNSFRSNGEDPLVSASDNENIGLQ